MNRSITAPAVRKLTLAPLLAAVMLLYLYTVQPGIFGSVRAALFVAVPIAGLSGSTVDPGFPR